ncbi:MAG: hypothetical protein PVG14_09010, partial [Anaerolineales bacterium]
LTFGIIPYRMGATSFLIIPLIFRYGLRINRVTIIFFMLVIVVFISGIINNSSITNTILFLRIPVFSYLIFYLVEIFIRPNNIHKIIKLSLWVGIIQLPLIAIEQLLYKQLPTRVLSRVILGDFDFGSFNFKGDAAMGFFLTLLVIFLLFDKKRNYIIRNKWFYVVWFTLTVLIANAEMVKLIILMVWGIYILRYLNPKVLLSAIFAFTVIIGILSSLGLFAEIYTVFINTVTSGVRFDAAKQEEFLSGGYGRRSAIAYYLSHDITWFGDGPGKYYNVLSKTFTRGNIGHIFTFYSEVGLIGWLLSIAIFFLIAFPIHKKKARVTMVAILIFISVQILGFTTQILNDISVFLIYCIIAKSYLIHPRKQIGILGSA